MSNRAIVSLYAGNDKGYMRGLAALARSARIHAARVPLVCLVEEGSLSEYGKHTLSGFGWDVKTVPPIRCKEVEFSAKRWECTFTKLHVFNETEYDRVLFLDADCILCSKAGGDLVWRNYDDLAACAVCKEAPGRFNSGVMLLKPSNATFTQLKQMVENEDPRKIGAYNGDQSVLNYYFGKRWVRIADKYNQRHWNKPKPGVAIAHLRPHPWRNKRPAGPSQRPYLRLWKKLAADAFGSGRASELIRRITDKRWTVAEVGVLNGRTSESVLRFCPNARLHMVDTWGKKQYADHTDKACRIKDWPGIKAAAMNAVKPFQDRVTVHHCSSVEAANTLPDAELDLVFVDAEHTYAEVKRDISAWLPKLKPGGIMCGHDYHTRWPGLVRAVNEVLGKPETGADATWFHRV